MASSSTLTQPGRVVLGLSDIRELVELPVLANLLTCGISYFPLRSEAALCKVRMLTYQDFIEQKHIPSPQPHAHT